MAKKPKPSSKNPAPQISASLQAAQANLAQQVASGGISQAQADAELSRLTGEEKKVSDLNALIGPYGGAATTLANQLFAPGSLGTVSTGFDAQGNRIYENQDVLNRYKGLSDALLAQGAPTRTGAQQGYLDQLQGDIAYTPEQQRYLQQMEQQQGRTLETSGALYKMRAGLDGYNSAELQGAREQALTQTRGEETNQMYQLAKLRGQGGNVGSMARDLARNSQRVRGNVERDLFVANADEKQKRLKTYSDYLSGTERDESDRRAQYGDYLGKAETAKSGRLGTYGTALTDAEKNETTNKTNYYNNVTASFGNYNNALQGIRADELDRQDINLQQVANEKAGQYGTYFGALNLGLANRQQDETEQINDKLYKLSKTKKPKEAAATTTPNLYY